MEHPRLALLGAEGLVEGGLMIELDGLSIEEAKRLVRRRGADLQIVQGRLGLFRERYPSAVGEIAMLERAEVALTEDLAKLEAYVAAGARR